MMFRFEKLVVWQKSIEFSSQVYKLTQGFPNEERFGLTSQMRRASVSISSNIAEGSGRSSDNDFARFIEIAYGSLMEVVSQMNIAKSQNFLQHGDFEELYQRANELSRMLSGLRTSLTIHKTS